MTRTHGGSARRRSRRAALAVVAALLIGAGVVPAQAQAQAHDSAPPAASEATATTGPAPELAPTDQPVSEGQMASAVAGTRFHSMSPYRVFDTREGTGGVPKAKVGPQGVISPTVTGIGGVPASGVTAVVLNVTAIYPSTQTHVTVWPTGETRPTASNLNVSPGWVVPNLVVAKVGSGGKVSLFNNSGTIDLLADVVGWYGPVGEATGSLHHGLSPYRVFDTREGTGGVPKAKVGTGGVISPKVTGVGGVPATGVTAVVLNVTAIYPSTQTHVTVWPTGETRPTASNLNVSPGWVIPNLVIAKVGAGGKVSLFNNSGDIDLLADVVGWYGTTDAIQGAAYTSLTPARVFDTREGTGVPKAKVGTQGVITPTVTGIGGVPASGVSAVVLNVTAIYPSTQTHITAWPTGEARPTASNLNVSPGWVIPNLVVAKVGSNGRISLFNNAGTVDLLADVVGWFGPETQWSTARQISFGTVSSAMRDPVTAKDAAGNIHVVWREGSTLLYRKLDGHGNTLIQTVNTGFAPMSAIGYGWRHVTVAPAIDGGAIISWYWPGTKPGIYLAKLDSGGRVAVEPYRIQPGNWNYLTSAVDSSGTYHLAARQNTLPDSTAASDRVYYVTFGTDLVPTSPWIAITERVGTSSAIYPSMAVQSDGTVHLTWFDNRRFPGTTNYDVFYTKLAANGSPSVWAQRVSDKAGGYAIVDDGQERSLAPAIDVDGTGAVRIVWITNQQHVYLSTVGAGGTVGVQGVELDLGTTFGPAPKAFGLQAHAEADGSTSVVLPIGTDTASKLVQLQVDGTGASMVSPAAIELGAGSWRYPSLTVHGGEWRIVVQRTQTTSAGSKLYVFSTAAKGDPVDRPDLLVDDAHSTDTSTPDPPREGTAVNMTVQVANAGWVASPATTATFSYGPTVLTTVAVPPLAVEQTATLAAGWTVPAGIAVDPAAITVKVDPLGSITETTEANNTVDHLVDLLLRPEGVGITALGWDETDDPAHDGIDAPFGFTAMLAGTTSEGDPWTKTINAGAADNRAWFGIVPPGTYTLTGSVAGYADPPSVAVTITRDGGDPYLVHVTPGGGPQLWFNRWGTVSGKVTGSGGANLSGVKVTDRETGKSTTTAANGTYSIAQLAAGTHHLTFTRNGYARLVDQEVTVDVASTTTFDRAMTTTTLAYIDVVVTNENGTPLPGALVELIPSGGGAAVTQCTTVNDGTCSMQATGGVAYQVRGTKQFYVTATSSGFTPAAGQVVAKELTLDTDVSSLSTASTGDKSVISWLEHHSVPLDGDVWIFWGNYLTNMSVGHQNVGGTEYVRSLDIALEGNPFYVELMKNDVGVDIGGPYSAKVPVFTSDTSSDTTNVRVDAVRLVDRVTGTVFFEQNGPGVFYSHTATGDTNAVAYLPDVGVDWANLEVVVDVRVGKSIDGTGGPAGWESSPIIAGWRTDTQRITWRPSTGAWTLTPRLS